MLKKILLIDDDQGDQILIEEALKSSGLEFELVKADTGEMGIQRVQEFLPDCILIDTLMPGIDGFETCRRIKQLKDLDVKVILYTGNAAAVDPAKAKSFGADQYCIKTAGSEEIINSIKQLELEDIYILVAEDDKTSEELIRAYFDLWNYQADYVVNGEEAVKCIKERSYDLFLSDLKMPVMNGVEAAKIIRTFNKDLPIIAVSASVLPEERQAALNAGMNDFIAKPMDILKLREVILKYAKHKKNA